jgi:cytochrome c-type biogenesis protein CcmH/NrfF
LPQRRRRSNLKLFVAFLIPLAALIAQDPTSYLTPNVLRVGDKLACRCGGCRNTVGNCPMLHCDSADPMRRRIYNMQAKGMSDSAIVSTIVREEGIVALASPPAKGLGPILTWIMPGIALLIGFWIYSLYVRRNRKDPEPLTAVDRAVIDRFHVQIERELGEAAEPESSSPREPESRK